MSQNLYEEAIAEARHLREMAEENAKNKIIDAVTPQIRQLIEQELMGNPEDAADDEELEDAAVAVEEPMVVDLDSLEADALAPAPQEEPIDTGDSAVLRVGADGGLGIEVGDVSIEVDAGGAEDEEEVLLDEPMAEALANMISKSSNGRRRLRKRLTVLEKKINVLGKALNAARTQATGKQRKKVAEIFESLAREAVILRRQVILTEKDTGGRILERKLVNSIIKEMKLMSRKNNKNIFDFLFEAEDDQATLREMDVVLSDDDLEALGVEEPGEVDVADLEVDLLLADAEEGEEEGGEEVEEEGGDDEPLDLGEMEEVYEIDEASLRRELRRLRKLNENDPTDGSGDSSFGDGSAGDEMFVDVDEDDLLNALADELGDAPMPDAGAAQAPGGDAMPESYRRRARRRASQRRGQRRGTSNLAERRARRQARDYKKVAGQLKNQLVEMNLFNAKLLYANKLMQNRDLTAKQQRAIVEALDNAKTLREAKLLYKSLTSSLNKRSSKKNLAEGRSTRALGSASKSARSAQPADGAGSLDRWATLAGINQDK
jgi:hypothetical protein